MKTKTISVSFLRGLVEEHPLRQMKGRFRVNLPFVDWEFSKGNEDPNPSETFSNFLKTEKPSLVLLTEDNKFMLSLAITTTEMFDGDSPTDSRELYFLLPELGTGAKEEKLLLILKTTHEWPDWEGGGEFIAQLRIP